MMCPNGLVPKGSQRLTGLAVAKGLTVPPGANYAIIRADGGDVRYRDDGSTPTTTQGMPLYEGEVLEYDSPIGIAALKFASTAGSVEVLYYGA